MRREVQNLGVKSPLPSQEQVFVLDGPLEMVGNSHWASRSVFFDVKVTFYHPVPKRWS